LTLLLVGSASAASFAATPGSLGPIPDGPNDCLSYGANRDVTFAVSGVVLPITNVAVSMTLTPAHPFAGDLSVALFSPEETGVTTIFERTGALGAETGYDADVAGPYTFSDQAPASPSWWQTALAAGSGTIPSGSYRASFPGGQASPPPGESYLLTPTWAGHLAGNPLPNGTWILRFRDHCSSGTGSVAAATLTLDGSPGAGPGTTTPIIPSTGQQKKCKKKKGRKRAAATKKKCKKRKRGH
jgi:hypothetical protein